MNSTEKIRTDRKTYRRLVVAFCLFAAIAAVIIGRLAKYQIKEYEYYQSQVLNQLTTETKVNPERGEIRDRNNIALASNATVYNIIISPSDIISYDKKIEKQNSDDNPDNNVLLEWTSEDRGASYSGTKMNELIATFLSYTLDVEYDSIIEKAAKANRMYEVIKVNVDEDTDNIVKDFIAEYDIYDLIYDRASLKRYYPYGDLAAHVLGFTNGDGVGIYGLEAYYNNLLEGTSGKYVLAQDAKKNDMPFEYETYIEAENGYNIVTTIDRYIQGELENQLESTYYDSGAGNRVCGIVMDPETGGILAMATYPTFDLNSPYTLDDDSLKALDGVEKGSSEYMNAIYEMWKNKAITETYEPGSTFKILTTAMGLEENVVTFEDQFNCSGSLKIENYPKPISCHKKTGHGLLPFRVGLQQSCNPALMQVAARIGEEKFYDYFEAFGYTSRTGIDLPSETAGLYSSRGDFTNVSLAVYSFGQTFKTTAIQQLTAISSVANGGKYVTPHLIKEIVDKDGTVVQSFETDVKRQVVSSEVCEEIAEVLEEGVSGDGGAKNAYVKGYKIAAKTGTSEKKDKKDENGEFSYRVGSCVAFAPSDDAQVAAIIIVDEPMNGSVYGSVVAAPYVANLLSNILPYLGIERQYTEEEMATLDVTLSNYVGGTAAAAKEDLQLNGLVCEIIGDGENVTDQFPAAGRAMNKENGKVLLYCGDGEAHSTVEVPDLINKTADAANKILINAGLNVKITGSLNGSTATVINQSPAAGETVEAGEIIEIELRHLDMTD